MQPTARGEWDLDLLGEINNEISQLENGADLLALTAQTQEELRRLAKMNGSEPSSGPDEDGETLMFKMNDQQAEVVNEALGHVLAVYDMKGIGNPDRRANAVYYICADYLARLHGETAEDAQPTEPPADA